MAWFAGFEEICRADVPLRDYTWYGLGGPARWLLVPRNEQELATLLRRCGEQAIPWRVLGHGANVLVRDEGFEGAVIRLSGPQWERTHVEGPQVHAAAGADFPRLVKKSVERGLVGLETLAGIPGTVGGVIRMNAGGRYGTISEYVRHVRVMAPDGGCSDRAPAQMGFAYRTSRLDGGIITAAELSLQPGDRSATLERFQRIWKEKHASQPPLAAKSAGCIFKNPPGRAAGALLDAAGLKGHCCGGAEISSRHANFIVAHPGATAQNVLDLITIARQRVQHEAGVELELEVEIW